MEGGRERVGEEEERDKQIDAWKYRQAFTQRHTETLTQTNGSQCSTLV